MGVFVPLVRQRLELRQWKILLRFLKKVISPNSLCYITSILFFEWFYMSDLQFRHHLNMFNGIQFNVQKTAEKPKNQTELDCSNPTMIC